MNGMVTNCNNCLHQPVCSMKRNFKFFVENIHGKRNELYKECNTNGFSVEVKCKYYYKDKDGINKDYL